MKYIAANCPNCGSNVKFRPELKTGFCIYCGTQIIINNVKDSSDTRLSNLLIILRRDIENGNNKSPDFKDRLNRALDIDPKNEELLGYYDSEIWNAEIINGSLINYFGSAEIFTVPSTITSIKDNTFTNSQNINTIVMHDDIEFIGADIFHGNPNEIKIIAESQNSKAARFAVLNVLPYEVSINKTDKITFGKSFDSLMYNIAQISKIKKDGINKIEKHYSSIAEKLKNKHSENRLRTIKTNSIIIAIIFLAFAITQGSNHPFLLWFFVPGGLLSGLAIFADHHLKLCVNKNNIGRYIKRDTSIWKQKFTRQINSFFNEYGHSDFSMIWNKSDADLKADAEYISKIHEILLESPIDTDMTFNKISRNMTYLPSNNAQNTNKNMEKTEEFIKLMDIV